MIAGGYRTCACWSAGCWGYGSATAPRLFPLDAPFGLLQHKQNAVLLQVGEGDLVIARDQNAAINILNKATAGSAGSYAWGEPALSGRSTNQETSLLAAR